MWSPTDDLIVYSTEVVAGTVALAAVRADGRSAPLPTLKVRPGSYRFLPNGTGLVYLPAANSPNFWMLDLVSHAVQQLTRFDGRGRLQTFDFSADGKRIIFDRWNENANIMLIARPAR